MVSLIEALRFGVMQIDASWAVPYANRVAQHILQQGDAMRLVDGCIEFRRKHDGERATRWLQQHGDDHSLPPFTLARSSGRRPYLLHRVPSRSGDSNGGQAVHVLLVLDPERPLRVVSGNLTEVFDLTRAEANLVAALANGEPLNDFSARVGITPGTARRHLERVFLKIGVERQSELVRLVLACALPLADVDDLDDRSAPSA